MSLYIVNGSPKNCLRCSKPFKEQKNECWHDYRDGQYYCSEECGDLAQKERLEKAERAARKVS